jgi:hypothetical protein
MARSRGLGDVYKRQVLHLPGSAALSVVNLLLASAHSDIKTVGVGFAPNLKLFM